MAHQVDQSAAGSRCAFGSRGAPVPGNQIASSDRAAHNRGGAAIVRFCFGAEPRWPLLKYPFPPAGSGAGASSSPSAEEVRPGLEHRLQPLLLSSRGCAGLHETAPVGARAATRHVTDVSMPDCLVPTSSRQLFTCAPELAAARTKLEVERVVLRRDGAETNLRGRVGAVAG